MSNSGRPNSTDCTPQASDVAERLRDAAFVHVFARVDGDCLAAAGLLARALAQRGVPYQIRAGRFGEAVTTTEDDKTTVSVGLNSGADVSLPSGATPASVTAYDAAAELDASPDPVLALAGVVAAGYPPGAGESAHVLDVARQVGVERRPGVGVPTNDQADGLAHSTLLHADWSGDPEAVRAELAELNLPADLDASAYERIASSIALSVAGDESATGRAGEAVGRALRPHATPDGPFATIEGYADVLETAARERPGAGTALVLGHDARVDALEAWRDHGQRAHRTLREGTTGRYDGLFVFRTDAAPVETVARLLRDFRSPEPVTLVVADGEAAVTAIEDAEVGATIREAASTVGGTGGGTARRGYARFDLETDATAFLSAFREVRK